MFRISKAAFGNRVARQGLLHRAPTSGITSGVVPPTKYPGLSLAQATLFRRSFFEVLEALQFLNFFSLGKRC